MNAQVNDVAKITAQATPVGGASARSAVAFARRGDLEAFLIGHGVARNAARRIAAGGWPALRKQSPMEAAVDSLIETINSSPLMRPER